MRFWQSSSTGKELDSETGYGYHGARYMDYALMTCWLSVDPLADKYPNISPYNYCMWSPLKLVDPDGKDNVIYLVNLQDKNPHFDATSLMEESNRQFSKMGLSTRVMIAPEGVNFNPKFIDNTDSYVVIGDFKAVSKFLGNNMSAGEYEKYFSDWAGGGDNPERSSKSLWKKTNAIAIDANGLNECAKTLGASTVEMGVFIIMHGAGHNATLGHADTDDDMHRSNLGNARIMASGNRIYRSGQSLDYFMQKETNSLYTDVMKNMFGINPATDNYYKNKNADATNKYKYCPRY